ncbi:MAG: hypothetical protein IH603_23485, partial [Burkholderia vietnamiensis]|nr:hypothetical protein [Burkholderia vietnamiensis]
MLLYQHAETAAADRRQGVSNLVGMIGIVVRTHDARRVSPAARQPARVRRVAVPLIASPPSRLADVREAWAKAFSSEVDTGSR